MSLFNFNMDEMLTFFAVLLRVSVLIAVLPFVGDKVVPLPVKILLSLAVALVLYPSLVGSGLIQPAYASVWGAATGSLVGTYALEVVFGLILGFLAKFSFDAISFGGSLIATYMGLGMASVYDPHQEAQTQVVSEIQLALAMLIFLALDGHHLMLQAALGSYQLLGIGALKLPQGTNYSELLMQLTGQVIVYGIALSAPVAVSMFAVNMVFGVIAKAMPQINVLVLSFSVSALVGLVVMFLSLPEFQGAAGNILGRMGDSMQAMIKVLAKGV